MSDDKSPAPKQPPPPPPKQPDPRLITYIEKSQNRPKGDTERG